MMPSRAGRVLRTALLGAGTALVLLVASAGPAAAHNVSSGSMPAPPWLLSYIGAFAVAATAVALRATWTSTRLAGFVAREPDRGVPPPPSLHVGHAVGVTLFGLALAAAIVGPDSSAANIAPVAVLVVWWVGLPLLCLVLGDVMRAINPFVAVVGLVDRVRPRSRPDQAAPTWTSAAFLATFAWFFIAYHRPGSARALATFLVVYALVAIGCGLRWGRAWLATGEGFGAVSAAVALFSPWRRRVAAPPGLAPLMVVWIASSAFDAFTSTRFWTDVLGTSQGWNRTALNTVGMVWLTAIVAGVYLVALRLADQVAARIAARTDDAEPTTASLAGPLGVALVPVALAWFLAHDLTLLLFEGQNFIALLSDPIGRGWNLVDTISNTVDYRIAQAAWVPWAQVALLTVGHLVCVVVAHDTALALVRRRRPAMRTTWAMATAAGASIVAGALLVLG